MDFAATMKYLFKKHIRIQPQTSHDHTSAAIFIARKQGT